MNFLAGHLADAANVSVEGKLNILGIFQVIHTSELPCHIPCTLVALFESEPFDRGQEHPVRIELIDEDGKLLTCFDQMRVGVPANAGLTSGSNIIVTFRPLSIDKYGAVSFKIFLSSSLVGEVRLSILPAEVR